MTDRDDVELLASTQARAAALAVEQVRKLMRRLEGQPAPVVKAALVDAVPALVAAFGDVAATAALQWYTATREKAAPAKEWTPDQTSPGPEPSEVDAGVRSAISPLWDEEATPEQRHSRVTDALASRVSTWVKYAGRDTVARNINRDPARPRWARVPRGAKTCAFCAMLASRGWVYTTETAAGAGQRFHHHCDCQIVPEWDRKKAHVAGYDPDAMYERYQQAREAVEKEGGDPNDETTLLGRMRRLHPDAYKDGIGKGGRTDGSGPGRPKGHVEHSATGRPKEHATSGEADEPVWGRWPNDVPQRLGGIRPYRDLASTPRLSDSDRDFAKQVTQVNPNYRTKSAWPEVWDPDDANSFGAEHPYAVNCVRCSNALALRILGYDVEAGAGTYLPIDAGIQNAREAVRRWSRDGQPVELLTWRTRTGQWSNAETIKALRRQPPGSFGVIACDWVSGSGHIWNWERRGNRLIFWDAQVGRMVSVKEYYDRAKAGTLRWARLDDAVPSDDVLDVVSIPEPERR